MGAKRVDQVVDGVPGLQGMRGVRQRDAVEAGLAVDIFGSDELAGQGGVAAGVDRGFQARKLDDLAGVALWVRGRGTFPATAVRARTSSSGEASASRMATASSWPGSVSMMILRDMGRSFGAE
jgi:hypothetical protein